jgi:hypothetical protein
MIIVDFFKYIFWCINNRKRLYGVKKIFDKGGRKCDDCGREHEIYSIIDTLWLKYCNKTDYICLDCFEKRLGRRITKNDLKNVQGNEFLFKDVN